MPLWRNIPLNFFSLDNNGKKKNSLGRTQNISLLKAASTIAVQSSSLMEQIYEVTAERYADHKIHDKCTLLHGSEIPYVLAVTVQ